MQKFDKALLLSLFGGYTVKVAVLGASPSDAAVVLVLAAAHFLYNSQIQNKEISNLRSEIESVNNRLNDQAKVLEDTRSAMSSIKIAQGLRPAK